MRAGVPLLLLAALVGSPEVRYFRYKRPVLSTSPNSGQTCLALDPALFSRTAQNLADLRLFREGTEVPYAIHLTAPAKVAEGSTPLLNLGVRDEKTVFDAAMPSGTYSDLQIDLNGENFIATVTISGSRVAGSAATQLGTFTIFDFTREKLGRSTILHLPDSDFSYLHFVISGPLKPDDLHGLSVLGRATSQPSYVPVATASQVAQKDRTSVVRLAVPAHVPVDRILFVPGAQPAAFTRNVQITITPAPLPASTDESEPPQPVTLSGNLLRLHRTQEGKRIDEERLAIDASGQTFDTPMTWTVTIENGDDAPLDIQSLRLEMVQRNLCFEANAGAQYSLLYGDPALAAPHYDYATLFVPRQDALHASAGPERPNPSFQPRPDNRPFTERHPTLLWAGLILVIALLGGLALKSDRRPTPSG